MTLQVLPPLEVNLANITFSSSEVYLVLLGIDYFGGFKGNLRYETVYLGDSMMTIYLSDSTIPGYIT